MHIAQDIYKKFINYNSVTQNELCPPFLYKITMKAYDVISHKDVTLKLTGYPAIVFQHEYDHLDGVLYYERIDQKDPLKEDPDAIRIE